MAPYVFAPRPPVRLGNRIYGSEAINSSGDTTSRPTQNHNNGFSPVGPAVPASPPAAPQYAPLSPLATPQNWAAAFDVALHRKSAEHPVQRKCAAAHAEIINGSVYGVIAIKPCSTCRAENKTCRIYHEDVHGSEWRKQNKQDLGDRCAHCRTSSTARKHGECQAA
ncbi:hypothetical protein FB567DRAFT_528630 [Paraphoma chrysanthemicola]|uniref:Uncharacterized protein n=1 Tax=Paraphoma chrysanthemicola TaxID=798071 RepID=A0A8K0R5D3_9PLEO|nr:hypothetical protein FB567DRAFT_528630 [Paraphoma chrysanthemicola]